MYYGSMNTTANTTAAPIRRRAPHSIPTAIDITMIPAIPMKATDKISVKLINYRGELSTYGHHFTLGSVAEYAARYKEDVEAAVARSAERGENLYYAIAEGILITAHRQAPVERTELALGTIIEMDGQKFQILQSPNDNLQLVPLPAG